MFPGPAAGDVRLREQLLPTIVELASSISGQPVQVTVLADTALPLSDSSDEASAADAAAPPAAAHESAPAPARSGSPRRYLPGLTPVTCSAVSWSAPTAGWLTQLLSPWPKRRVGSSIACSSAAEWVLAKPT